MYVCMCHRVDRLEEECSEGHVVAYIQEAHEPADRSQHAGVDAVVQLQHHPELDATHIHTYIHIHTHIIRGRLYWTQRT